ncbi:MAG: Ig-like domain-containing protein [Pyrinomonadaceae bacterium]
MLRNGRVALSVVTLFFTLLNANLTALPVNLSPQTKRFSSTEKHALSSLSEERLANASALKGPLAGFVQSKAGSSAALSVVQETPQASTAEAYFMFNATTAPDTFVFKLTDPAKIQEARNIISGRLSKLVVGTIIKRPVYYNSPWHYYLDPKSISFADAAVEVCDASIRYLEDNLAGAYPHWCPWGTRQIREIAAPAKPGTGNIGPNVSMTFPHYNNTFATEAPANVTLMANADDPDGSVSKVEFYQGSTKLGEDAAYPYSYEWKDIPPGAYTVSAVATDNLGASSPSNSVTFSVNEPTTNPIDNVTYFVRRHYLDFLNREPDSDGYYYWSYEIGKCGPDTACVNARRVSVSAAFFIETEFQDTGYFVYRFYKASYGRQPSFAAFMPDREQVVGGANLEASKQAFADAWVQRASFLADYPANMSNADFVGKLFDTAGLSPYASERAAQIDAMNGGKARAQVLRDVIEIAEFKTREYNPAFVRMQYFGYLRRDPDGDGEAFWLNVLNNAEPNNYLGMVCSFITSTEYQKRFSNIITRSNAECASIK